LDRSYHARNPTDTHHQVTMLEGIKVLDLSRVIAGPYCGMLLADLGADVIKVERPGAGDDMRHIGGKDGISPAFAAVNRNKRGIAIDLKKPEGRDLALILAARADVVIENFLPGTAAEMGLGYQAVRALNPAIIYASVSGFGQDGPKGHKPGYNGVALGMSGISALTGVPGGPPLRPGGSMADAASSYMAFARINAALVHRLRTGQGQHIDVNLLSSALGLLPRNRWAGRDERSPARVSATAAMPGGKARVERRAEAEQAGQRAARRQPSGQAPQEVELAAPN
jgi:crotonobetainyl-CoA:carnitine CoA-transferase CaiB-like acyl-CoA transferase